MFKRKTPGLLLTVSVLLLVGCSSGPHADAFFHKGYRKDYLITDQELKKIQFFVSTDVVVQDLSFLEGGPRSMVN